MKLRARRLISLLILALWLSACAGTPSASPTAPASPIPQANPFPTRSTAQPVSPVVGMPAGTDGYPWWNDTVFYEIFVRSFYDSNGDGVGDLKGIVARLDYLSDLGVTGVWLMPIHPSPSYHGYDVTDYYSVNPDYGTLDDFKQLLIEAHKRGIRVIIDLVLNHTSDQHPWFVASKDPQSPFRDWYVWSKTDPGQAYWHPAASGFYYGFFQAGMPDLNYTNPDVTDKMEDVVRFWMQTVGVDGFRLDAAKYLIEEGTVIQNSESTHTWYKNLHPFYKQLNPQALMVGEVWDSTATASDYSQGDQLDMTFDFDLEKAFITGLRTGRAGDIAGALSISTDLFKRSQFGAFLANHDMNRVMSQIGANVDKARLGAVLLLTAPGVPFLYYGDEIGMLGKKPDEDIRTPMQWTSEANGGFTTGRPWRAVNPDYPQVNAAIQSADPHSLLSLYRALIRLRNQHAALRVGDFHVVQTANPVVFSSLRLSKSEAILIVVNLDKNAVSDYDLSVATSPLPGGTYRGVPMLDGGPQTVDALAISAQGGFDAYQPLPTLPANSSLMLQLQLAQ